MATCSDPERGRLRHDRQEAVGAPRFCATSTRSRSPAFSLDAARSEARGYPVLRHPFSLHGPAGCTRIRILDGRMDGAPILPATGWRCRPDRVNAPLAACSLERKRRRCGADAARRVGLQQLSALRAALRGLSLEALAPRRRASTGTRSLRSTPPRRCCCGAHCRPPAPTPRVSRSTASIPATGAFWSWCASGCRRPAAPGPPVQTGMLAQLGRQTVALGALIAGHIAFLG